MLVLRTGDAVSSVAARYGEFAAWIAGALGDVFPGGYLEHDARRDAPLPNPRRFAAIVVTGSASSVTERAPWMRRTEAYLRAAMALEVPILGICFGHQILAQALGGHVRKNPRGREIGTVALDVVAGDDPLFAGLPGEFAVNASHVDTVALLPPGASVLGRTALEPHAALAFGPRARGVQFHPEITAPIMRGYVEARRTTLAAEGLDPITLLSRVRETPRGGDVLCNFVRELVLAA